MSQFKYFTNYFPCIHVILIQVDVIVNTTSTALKLTDGALSKSLLKAAGKILQVRGIMFIGFSGVSFPAHMCNLFKWGKGEDFKTFSE